MASGVTELTIQTRLHAVNWWIVIPVVILGIRELNMVLDTGAPFSAISDATYDLLVTAGLIERRTDNWCILRGLVVQGQPVPDQTVRVSRRVSQARAEGVLGLDFLRQYAEIRFYTQTLRLTLIAS